MGFNAFRGRDFPKNATDRCGEVSFKKAVFLKNDGDKLFTPNRTQEEFEQSMNIKELPALASISNWISTPLSISTSSWKGIRFEVRRGEKNGYIQESHHESPILTATLAGDSNIRWRAGNRSFQRQWKVGTCVYMAKDFLIEDLQFKGSSDQILFALDFDQIGSWFHEDFQTGISRTLQPHIISEDNQLLSLAQLILSEFSTGCRQGAVYSESLSIALVGHLISRYSVSSSPAPISRIDPAKLSDVEDLIRTNLSSNLSLEEISKHACMSPRHFTRCFKLTTGNSVHRYILEIKMSEAKKMLACRISITEVAFTLGFSSAAHFSTTFKHMIGVSPRVFRNLYKQ